MLRSRPGQAPYLLLPVLGGTAILQLKHLNQAMHFFPSSQANLARSPEPPAARRPPPALHELPCQRAAAAAHPALISPSSRPDLALISP